MQENKSGYFFLNTV